MKDTFSYPKIDGKMVVEVLEKGNTETEFHCRMDDGTTQHINKELFIND